MKAQQKRNRSIIAIWISLFSNIVLTVVKIVIGFLFQSQVLLADGIHNAGDVIATFAALLSTSVSHKPADEDHPFGHGKAEVIASGIVALIMAIASFYMVYKSVESLLEPAVEASFLALYAAVLSLVWKQALYIYCIRIGKLENSKSLIATAKDHLADVYASAAAVVGIAAAIYGDSFHISIAKYGDPIAGIVVSIFVAKLAYEMGHESIHTLMERNLPQERLKEFTDIVESISDIKRIDRIRAREHGHYVIVDLRVSIHNQLTIQEGHDIIREIKRRIMQEHPDVEEVLVHLNPWHP